MVPESDAEGRPEGNVPKGPESDILLSGPLCHGAAREESPAGAEVRSGGPPWAPRDPACTGAGCDFLQLEAFMRAMRDAARLQEPWTYAGRGGGTRVAAAWVGLTDAFGEAEPVDTVDVAGLDTGRLPPDGSVFASVLDMRFAPGSESLHFDPADRTKAYISFEGL